MAYASDRLVDEHHLIERMIAALKTAVDRLESGEDVPAELFLQAVDFIRNFADRTHHAKEEDILFRLMEERGIPREGGPVGVMLTEHDYGRQFNRGLEEAAQRLQNGDKSAVPDIISNARGYAQLLTDHIYKENNILYPMGNHVFTTEDQQFLSQEFERVDKESIGEDTIRKYRQMVDEMEKKLQINK